MRSSNIVPWADKAIALYAFAGHAGNSAREKGDGMARAGSMVGGAIMLSFAVECAIKALLESEGKRISKRLRKHDLHELFQELCDETQANAVLVYASIVAAEKDRRVHVAPLNDLRACLKHHADAFMTWRYYTGSDARFYPVGMSYACVSLLTLAHPDRKFGIASRSLPPTDIKNGRVVPQADGDD